MPTTLQGAVDYYRENEPRGEYVLVVAGADPAALSRKEEKKWEAMSIPEHMALYEEQGLSRKDAMKQVAKDRGVSKRDIYAALLPEDGSKE